MLGGGVNSKSIKKRGTQMRRNGTIFIVIFSVATSVLGCSTITKNTTLTANRTTRIIIGADSITLNCDGHTITGSGTGSGNGIKLVSRTGVTIRNCTVTNFDDGIQINQSNNNTFENNLTHHNIQEGFDIEDANTNNFVENTSRDNGRDGFDVGTSSSNTFTGNVATGNGTSGSGGNGIELDFSASNILTANTVNNNALNGFSLDSSSGNTFEGNTADNNTERGFQIETSNNGSFRNNHATGNANEDARQDGFSTGNAFCGNTFGTIDNIPVGYNNPC